jgi:hypothetical protein
MLRLKLANRMTPQFEGHVRTMMATGGSERQVRDNLALCAQHFWGRRIARNKKEIKNMIPPGIALTAHPVLQQAVNELCSVRTRKSGAITNLVREANKADVVAKNEMRKRIAREEFEENVRLKTMRAEKRDKAEYYTAMTALVTDVHTLNVQLAARKRSNKSRLTVLTEQYHAQVSGANPRIYPGIGDDFRKKFGKLRLTPKIKGNCVEALSEG